MSCAQLHDSEPGWRMGYKLGSIQKTLHPGRSGEPLTSLLNGYCVAPVDRRVKQ